MSPRAASGSPDWPGTRKLTGCFGYRGPWNLPNLPLRTSQQSLLPFHFPKTQEGPAQTKYKGREAQEERTESASTPEGPGVLASSLRELSQNKSHRDKSATSGRSNSSDVVPTRHEDHARAPLSGRPYAAPASHREHPFPGPRSHTR